MEKSEIEQAEHLVWQMHIAATPHFSESYKLDDNNWGGKTIPLPPHISNWGGGCHPCHLPSGAPALEKVA